MEEQEPFEQAIEKLSNAFSGLDLTFRRMPDGKKGDLSSYWPGQSWEDIIVCAFKGNSIEEPFHRQDFFFINYAYRGHFQVCSVSSDNLITVNQDSCYIGQPYHGYALRGNGNEEIIILGILIRRDFFYRELLKTFYADRSLFQFLVAPQTDRFSQKFVKISCESIPPVRRLFEWIAFEYAYQQDHSQQVLKSLLQTLLFEIARHLCKSAEDTAASSITSRVIEYIDQHSDTATLKSVATHFSYHPNYLSTLLLRESGLHFSEIRLKKRMERAVLLMQNTPLSIEEISSMLGYCNHSNFFKAFRSYYGMSPRNYITAGQPHSPAQSDQQ